MDLDGRTQREIAEMVGVSQQQVSADLAEIRRRWSASAVDAMAEIHAEQLAKLDHLEATAWNAWDRSKADGPGNPRFLAQVGRCIDQRVKILGLAAPERNVATLAVVPRPYIDLSDAELLALGLGKSESKA